MFATEWVREIDKTFVPASLEIENFAWVGPSILVSSPDLLSNHGNKDNKPQP